MADFKKIKIGSTWYYAKDETARTAANAASTAASNAQTTASNAQATANSKLSDAPSDGKQYLRKDGAWVESGILYFYQQPVSAATSAQIIRIPASGTNSAITADTVVLECTFANLEYVTSDVSWTSYAGYISFVGTCTAATTANVTLGQKS